MPLQCCIVVALALLLPINAWFWVVSAHRIDGQPFSGFAQVFITGCGDFEHFYHAARAMRDGNPLYTSGAHGHIYTPLIAFLFMPLTLLPVKSAALVMLLINMALGLACAWLAAREVIRRFQINPSPGSVLIVSAIVTLMVATRLRSEFQMWQTNVPMMLLMLVGLRTLDPHPQLAGLSLGIAVSIKYLPLLLLPYLLLRRRFAAAAWMVVGIVGFALLSALASGWEGNLQDLQVALSGLLNLLGFATVSAKAANVDPITVGHSISITSAISRLLGPDVPTRRALLISGAIARIYKAADRPLLRWPNAATQLTQPYLGMVALEWMALMVLALAFSPQTNPRHTSLLPMVSVPLAAMLCFPRAGVPKWPLVTVAAIMVFGLAFPPNTPALAATLNWWPTIDGTGWCMALMLPFLFIAGLGYLRRHLRMVAIRMRMVEPLRRVGHPDCSLLPDHAIRRRAALASPIHPPPERADLGGTEGFRLLVAAKAVAEADRRPIAVSSMSNKARMNTLRNWMFMGSLVAVVAFAAWASDRVSPQGERTVYTVACRNGNWHGSRCTGRLAAEERFRFRALRDHTEVLFWNVGSPGLSGEITDCVIQDGRNWTCNPNADSQGWIAKAMSRGHPLPNNRGVNRPIHSVPKWKWHLIRLGIWTGVEADT